MVNNVFLLGQQWQEIPWGLILPAWIIQMTLYIEKDTLQMTGYYEMSRLGWSCYAPNQNLHSVPSQYLSTDVF